MSIVNRIIHYSIFIIFSILSFAPLFYTYENLNLSFGPIYTDDPALSINPDYLVNFEIYKLFLNTTPYIDLVNLVNTLNLVLIVNISNSGVMPVYIGGIYYRVYVNGLINLVGQIVIGDVYRPGDSESFRIVIKIPIKNDTEFINQLYFFQGFLHVYINGYVYLRIASIPSYKTFSYGFDVSMNRVLKSYLLGEKVRIPNGVPEILSVSWWRDDKKIGEVSPGDTVYVSVLLTSRYDDFEGSLTIYVYKDLVLFPDEIYKGRVYSIHIAKGEIKNIVFKFKAPEEFEINLLGFYIVVEDEHGRFRWVMPDRYPPRLSAGK